MTPQPWQPWQNCLNTLMKDGFADKLRQVTSADQLLNSLIKPEKLKTCSSPANESGDFIVAVTACTTGNCSHMPWPGSPSKVAAEMGVGIIS